MGNKNSVQRVNYEDIQNAINMKQSNVLLINTLENIDHIQSCILPNTIHFDIEEKIINKYLNTNKDINIIIYGRNANDSSIYEKYTQLQNIGFKNVYVYPGGMFEWMLLQDIYGQELFNTTQYEIDILKFKPMNGI